MEKYRKEGLYSQVWVFRAYNRPRGSDWKEVNPLIRGGRVGVPISA